MNGYDPMNPDPSEYGKTVPTIAEAVKQSINATGEDFGVAFSQLCRSLDTAAAHGRTLTDEEYQHFTQTTQAELNMVSRPSDIALLRPEPELPTEAEIMKLLQEYRSLDQERLEFAKELLIQHSEKAFPEQYPDQIQFEFMDELGDRFEFVKSFDDLAFHVAFPDTVTQIREEIHWWVKVLDTNLFEVEYQLCESGFRHRQYEILKALGYKKASMVLAWRTPEIPFTPHDLMKEDAFISSLEQRYVQTNPRQQRQAQVKFWLSHLPFLKRLHCNCCGVIHVSKASPNHCDRCIDALGGEGDRPLMIGARKQ